MPKAPPPPKSLCQQARFSQSGSFIHARSVRAFTLIEVVIATFVMAFGIVTAVITINSSFKQLDYARNLTLASQILQSELERLRLLPWDNDTGGDSITALPSEAQVDISSIYSSSAAITDHFTLTRDVTPTKDREDSMRDITLVVSWTSVYGTTHTRTFVTRYCKDGLYDFYYTLAR